MTEIVMICLCALPFVLIGFGAGLFYARSVYKPTFRWQRKQIQRYQRDFSRASLFMWKAE